MIAGSSLTNQRTDSSSLSLFQLTLFLGLRGFFSAAAAASAPAAAAAEPQAAPVTAACTAPGAAAAPPTCRPPRLDPKPARCRSPGKRPDGWMTRSVTDTVCSGVTCRSTATRGLAAAADGAGPAVLPRGGGDGRRGRWEASSLLPAAGRPAAAVLPVSSLPASAVSTSCTPPVCRPQESSSQWQ